MNGVIAVIEDTVAISSSILTKAFTDRWFMDRACEHYESRALTASLTSSKIDITFNRIPQILLKIVSGKPLEIINRHLFHARRKNESTTLKDLGSRVYLYISHNCEDSSKYFFFQQFVHGYHRGDHDEGNRQCYQDGCSLKGLESICQ
jgi:hypothetical protein